jgi:hypothetical protein
MFFGIWSTVYKIRVGQHLFATKDKFSHAIYGLDQGRGSETVGPCSKPYDCIKVVD